MSENGAAISNQNDLAETGQALEPQDYEDSVEQLPELPLGPEDKCDTNSEFAVICCFLAQFGDKIDLVLDIEQLKSSIENQEKLDESLIDIHVKLIKKIRRYFVRDQWEKALIKFACEYSYEHAYEIESLGYLKTRPSVKLALLRRLLDVQFDSDQKFKATINSSEAEDLRILPMGRDLHGNTYWDRLDNEGNFRIFQEQPLDYKQWNTVCKNIDELGNLISKLDACKDDKIAGQPTMEPYNPLPEIFPQYFLPKQETLALENQSNQSSKTSKKGKNSSKSAQANRKSTLKPINEVSEAEKSKTFDIKPPITNGFISILAPAVKIESKIKVKLEPDYDSLDCQVKQTLDSLLKNLDQTTDILQQPANTQEPTPCDDPAAAPEQEIKAKPQARKRQPKKEKKTEEVLPRRTSSRIQQIQLKKQEEEQKKLIEASLKKASCSMTNADNESGTHSLSSSRGNKKRSDSPDNHGKKKRSKSWRPGQKSKKLSWDKDDSDISSTSSPTESDDDLDETIQSDIINYDDEFACEEEDNNGEPVIVKRARTVRPSGSANELGDESLKTTVEEDKPCGRCGGSHDPDWILLCDKCDDGYHTMCCIPPLMVIPDGDWFCPPCEHKMLLDKLRNLHVAISEILEEKERERLKRQRLRQAAAKKVEPITLKIESGSLKTYQRRQKYPYDELADPIALQRFEENMDRMTDEETGPRTLSVNRAAKPPRTYSARRKRSRDNFIEDEEEDSEGEAANRRVEGRENKWDTGNTRQRACKKPRNLEWDEEDSITEMSNNSDDSEAVIESDDSDEVFESDELANESDTDVTEEESRSATSVSSEEVQPKTRRARASVSYRFQEYDDLIKSAIQGDSNDGAASDTSELPVQCNYGRGKDMATIEALAYQQENGLLNQQDMALNESLDPIIVPTTNTDTTTNAALTITGSKLTSAKPRKKKKRRKLNDLDAESEAGDTTSDESFQASSATEAEDDDLTEAGSNDLSDSSIDEIIAIKHMKKRHKTKKRRSGYKSDDSDYQPRSSRVNSKGIGLLID